MRRCVEPPTVADQFHMSATPIGLHERVPIGQMNETYTANITQFPNENGEHTGSFPAHDHRHATRAPLLDDLPSESETQRQLQ